jgi:hypothetical protein
VYIPYVPLQMTVSPMWGCEYCGTSNGGSDKRCGECGAPRSKMKVAYIDVGDMFERFLDKIAHSTEAKDDADIPKREVHYLAVQLKEGLKESGLL